MARYLDATNRIEWRLAADQAREQGLLHADANANYDQVIEINLNEIEPTISGPFSPGMSALLY
jgi:homoaconitase